MKGGFVLSDVNDALITGKIEANYELNSDGTYSDLPRSSLPVQIDNINEMQDITADLIDLQNQFYTYVNNKDLTGASNLLNNNPQLIPCLFNAEKYNSLRDTIVALQRMFLDDIEKYIMNISQPKGEWKTGIVYNKYDVVSYPYEDAIQFYCARAMSVPVDAPPSNTEYWTPVTLRGMRGHTGLGLTPTGLWNKATQYYNFTDENNIPHVSMAFYNNAFWMAVSNNVNSEPTGQYQNGVMVSTNPNWEIAMALNQAANTILMPDNKTLAQVREEWDATLSDWNNRTRMQLDTFISNGYNYYASKESSNPLVWKESANDAQSNIPYAEIISKKVSSNEWQIQHICNSEKINYTIQYIKDENGNWKGVKM